MEIKGFDLIGFDLFGIDLNTIDINADNSIDVKESYIPTTQSPYIKGHITTSDSTFTFKVNNTSTSVSVNANGDFKYKPTTTITQLDFVGVPELESLELYKINGVTTFNVDYPTEVTFKKCDTTTQSSKVDVYHIRGTATSDFTFTLKYIDDNNTVTTVTESAVIDGDGKWDVAYSGKKITSLYRTFKGKSELTFIELTEKLDNVTSIDQLFLGTSCSVLMKNATFEGLPTDLIINIFQSSSGKSFVLPKAIFKTNKYRYFFYLNSNVETIDLSSIDASLCTDITGGFQGLSSLKNLKLPNNSSFGASNINLSSAPLTYESMLCVAGWLKDLTGQTTQTVTFKKATYDALTAEQKATLEGIIVAQKHWILATA